MDSSSKLFELGTSGVELDSDLGQSSKGGTVNTTSHISKPERSIVQMWLDSFSDVLFELTSLGVASLDNSPAGCRQLDHPLTRLSLQARIRDSQP